MKQENPLVISSFLFEQCEHNIWLFFLRGSYRDELRENATQASAK